MKAKYLKLIMPALISVACLSGCKQERKRYIYTLPSNTEITGTYYKTLDFEKKGARMINHLHSFIYSKHTTWVLYKDFQYYCQKNGSNNSTDAIADKSNKVEQFYTGKQVNSTSAGTREHVWPCNDSSGLWTHNKDDGAHYVDGTGYTGGGSDLFHVRPCGSAVNTARGDSAYVDFLDFPDKKKEDIVEVGDGLYPLKIWGATKSGKSYSYAQFSEPADEMKGDVARILAYVYVHYSKISLDKNTFNFSEQQIADHNDYCGALTLTSVLGYATEEECREVLCKWNEYDPPSEVEKLRNTTVQKIQGNRNPFVDYPGLIERMFGYEQEVK